MVFAEIRYAAKTRHQALLAQIYYNEKGSLKETGELVFVKAIRRVLQKLLWIVLVTLTGGIKECWSHHRPFYSQAMPDRPCPAL
jgi:hypothetical protein